MQTPALDGTVRQRQLKHPADTDSASTPRKRLRTDNHEPLAATAPSNTSQPTAPGRHSLSVDTNEAFNFSASTDFPRFAAASTSERSSDAPTNLQLSSDEGNTREVFDAAVPSSDSSEAYSGHNWNDSDDDFPQQSSPRWKRDTV